MIPTDELRRLLVLWQERYRTASDLRASDRAMDLVGGQLISECLAWRELHPEGIEKVEVKCK